MHANTAVQTKHKDWAPMPSVLGAAVFALLTLALLAVHVLYFAPNRARVERATPFAGDRSALSEAMAPESVAARFGAIADLGSRAPGQPGLEATALYIEDDFSKLGFEIYRQDVDIPYPLLREGSGWMSNENFRLDVLPFRPNFVQPVTTGAEGIDGELFLATDEAIRGGVDFTGKIAVIDTGGSIFKDFGLDPVRYADIGFAAVIITHSKGLEKAPWEGRAALGFDATEPLAGQMPLLCTNGWFTAEQQEADGEPRPVILPDVLAAQLGIAPRHIFFMFVAEALVYSVLAFLHDYFDSLGEGSSGIFFSGRPELRVSDRLDDLADNAYIPELKVRVWLKPFDLGVSQDVEIELGTDPETRECIARMTITRLTGTLESWYRLNKSFVTAVRRQFLHWRAVGDAQKSALFAKAKALMNG